MIILPPGLRVWYLRGSGLGAYDDLSQDVAVFHFLFGFAKLFQGKDRIDHRFQLSFAHEAKNLKHVFLASHIGAEDRELAAEYIAEIDLHAGSGSCSTGYQTSMATQGQHIFFPKLRTSVLDDDVNTALLCDVSNLLHKVLFIVVDQKVRTQCLCLLQLIVCAGSCENTRSECFCNLDRRNSHTASGGLNQHSFTRSYTGT